MSETTPTVDIQTSTSSEPDTDEPRRRRRRLRWAALAGGVGLLAALIATFATQFGKVPSFVNSAALLGQPAPAFNLPGLDGPTVSSASFGGRVEVINFWASWCPACRAEARSLESFYQRWSQHGVEMTGIVYGDSASNARAFDTQYGITYPNVMDPDGRAAISYGVSGVPETFVVAPDGRIAAHIVGGVGANTLDQVMARLGQSSGPISLQGPGYESKP